MCGPPCGCSTGSWTACRPSSSMPRRGRTLREPIPCRGGSKRLSSAITGRVESTSERSGSWSGDSSRRSRGATSKTPFKSSKGSTHTTAVGKSRRSREGCGRQGPRVLGLQRKQRRVLHSRSVSERPNGVGRFVVHSRRTTLRPLLAAVIGLSLVLLGAAALAQHGGGVEAHQRPPQKPLKNLMVP